MFRVRIRSLTGLTINDIAGSVMQSKITGVEMIRKVLEKVIWSGESSQA